VRRSIRRSVLVVVLSGLFTLVAVPLTGSPAQAHNFLESSTPAKDAALTVAPPAAVLVFSERVNPSFARVAVTGADGRSVTTGKPQTSGAQVTQPLAVTVSGQYTVAYRVVSADGHPVQGVVKFSVTLPTPSPSPVPSAPETSAAAVREPTPDGTEAVSLTAAEETRRWPYALLGVLVLGLLGAGLTVAVVRRNRAASAGPE